MWTDDPIDGEAHGIAINGSAYVISDGKVVSFFRGVPTASFSTESPTNVLTATAVCANGNIPDRFAVLDARERRVVIYGEDGSLLRQYYHESFEKMTGCALEKTGERLSAFSTTSVSVLTLR